MFMFMGGYELVGQTPENSEGFHRQEAGDFVETCSITVCVIKNIVSQIHLYT